MEDQAPSQMAILTDSEYSGDVGDPESSGWWQKALGSKKMKMKLSTKEGDKWDILNFYNLSKQKLILPTHCRKHKSLNTPIPDSQTLFSLTKSSKNT